MTDVEEKSLRTQLELLRDINTSNNMIIHTVQTTAATVLNNIIKPKMFIKNGQTTVELTIEEFTDLRVAIARLSDDRGFREMNGWINGKYIEPKIEKLKILSMLS